MDQNSAPLKNIDINNPQAITAVTADVRLFSETGLHPEQLDQSESQESISN